jgi:hypothetical protein
MEEIPFLVTIPEPADAKDLKGFLSNDGSYVALREISVDKLRENLQRVSWALLNVLADIKSVGEFELSEVEIGVEITAEGGVEFIGSSKVGGKGAIKLKFSRPE